MDPSKPPATGADYFSRLPAELKSELISYFSPPDVTILRLISKSFASLGLKGLFDGQLTVRMHRDGMSKLLAVSRIPNLAASILEIEIFAADFDAEMFRMVTKDLQTHDKDFRFQLDTICDTMSEAQSSFCQRNKLNAAFRNYPSVSSLIMTSSKFPFEDVSIGDHLRQTWSAIKPRTTHLGSGNQKVVERTAHRYANVLLAAKCFSTPLKKLALKDLPISVLQWYDIPSNNEAEEISILEEMVELCGSVDDLQMDFRDFSIPTGRRIHTLSKVQALNSLLASLQRIKSLELSLGSLGLSMSQRGDVLSGIKLPCLEVLTIELTMTQRQNLLQFLGKHRATLRKLHLSSPVYMSLLEGSGIPCEDFMTSLRQNLTLERFEMSLCHQEAGIVRQWRSNDVSEGGASNTNHLERFVKGEVSWFRDSSGGALSWSGIHTVS